MRQYFLTIPRDLEEAAKLDGAGHFKTFWKVMLPLAGPAIAAVTILEFQGTWNDFFWPLIIFNTSPTTHAAGRHLLSSSPSTRRSGRTDGVQRHRDRADRALYVFFQRYFVDGIASAGVKG